MVAPIEHSFSPPADHPLGLNNNEKDEVNREADEVAVPQGPTVEELRAALPPHCTEIDLQTSTYYLLRDYAAIAFLYAIVPYVEEYGGWTGLFVWYCVQGLFMSALFLIGHECVHDLFANQKWINVVAGHLSLSPIWVPFYPWEHSHRMHHQHSYHVEKDCGHPWVTEEDYKSRNWFVQHFCAIPISAFFRFHMYMLLGLPDGSHFNPFNHLLRNNKERFYCVCSILSCVFCGYIAYLLCGGSWFHVFKYYYGPLAFQNYWLNIVTYLNHNDEEVEVYERGTWKYMKAQLQTIDRYFGFGIDHILHHASDGHVAHHIFYTKIPHYHLMEATQAFIPVLEKHKGSYKRKSCYSFLWEFLRLNVKLEYLVGKGSGTLRFRVKPKAA